MAARSRARLSVEAVNKNFDHVNAYMNLGLGQVGPTLSASLPGYIFHHVYHCYPIVDDVVRVIVFVVVFVFVVFVIVVVIVNIYGVARGWCIMIMVMMLTSL